jgi:hypothetical protein
MRTPRGRVATPNTYRRLGMQPPAAGAAAQANIFEG